MSKLATAIKRVRSARPSLQTIPKLQKSIRLIMEECVRRALLYHDADFRAELLLPAYPSHVKPAVKAGLLRCLNRLETPRVMHWYRLTAKGIELAKTMVPKDYKPDIDYGDACLVCCDSKSTLGLHTGIYNVDGVPQLPYKRYEVELRLGGITDMINRNALGQHAYPVVILPLTTALLKDTTIFDMDSKKLPIGNTVAMLIPTIANGSVVYDRILYGPVQIRLAPDLRVYYCCLDDKV